MILIQNPLYGHLFPAAVIKDFEYFLKNDRMALIAKETRRGAGVAEQGRLLSDCPD